MLMDGDDEYHELIGWECIECDEE